ncbi:hypothetical protein RIF29_08129 [Crotalaria pallida]|uniref:Uncharacterized protein n=1 Tax=Crotalaria pallida TaxID=3830 RepID=A0AAN9J6A3_CROPI
MSMANRDVEVEVEEEEEGPLKIYFIPYLASGHMIPLFDIATLFASRGHHVTIITTPFNAQSFTNNLHRKPDHHLHIHTVDFPYQEVGLSPDSGVEIMSNLTDLATSVL